MNQNNNRVLGIDVGIAITGWSIIDKSPSSNKNILKAYGDITTKAGMAMEERLLILHNELTEVVKKFEPTEYAVEDLFYFKNKKTVIAVAQARGVILMTAATNGLQVFSYTPLQVKTAVSGYGRASKKQVQQMVKVIYKLEEMPKPDDVADAIAVGTCHLNTARFAAG